MARIEFKPNPAAAANGIKFPGGGNVSASLQTLQDPGNNSLPIAVSNSAVTFGTGTITSNGVVTIKGAGANSLSVRNSSNIETNSISSAGIFFSNGIAWNSGGRILPNGDGVIVLYNSAATSFNRMQLGGTSASEPAISKNGSGISITDATGSNTASLLAKDFTSSNLSAGALTTAAAFKVGSRAAISEAGLTALGLTVQIAIEHNGTVYYVPVSAAQFA